MEAKPKLRSRSHYLQLTNIDDITKYASLLGAVLNNAHKYVVVDNTIKADIFGNPYIIFSYSDNENEEERIQDKYSVFGKIVSVGYIQDYDDLVTDHWAGKIKLIYVQDYCTKDKEAPFLFKLMIFVKAHVNQNIKDEDLQRVKPVSA